MPALAGGMAEPERLVVARAMAVGWAAWTAAGTAAGATEGANEAEGRVGGADWTADAPANAATRHVQPRSHRRVLLRCLGAW